MTLSVGERSRDACFVIAIVAFVLVGHGCHGPDVDHEPSVIVPVRAP